MNIKKELQSLLEEDMQISNLEVDPTLIKAILINEIVPSHPQLDFYGEMENDYVRSTISLFQKAGAHIDAIEDIVDLGIYITNAVKTPKMQTTIPNEQLEKSIPILEKELALFPNVQVIMLMGDVAKKALNRITKKQLHRHVIPAISTYKLRNTPLYYKNVRIFPSYIMTGKNIMIEKSKVEMASQDIAAMLAMIS